MSKYLKWGVLENELLLNAVLDGIMEGKKIVEVLTSFANTYDLPVGSVKSHWQGVADKNREYVDAAKASWKNHGKPELEAKIKAEKALAKSLARGMKAREKWRKEKEKRQAKSDRVRLETNRVSKPSDRKTYVKVDENGLVMEVVSEVIA